MWFLRRYATCSARAWWARTCCWCVDSASTTWASGVPGAGAVGVVLPADAGELAAGGLAVADPGLIVTIELFAGVGVPSTVPADDVGMFAVAAGVGWPGFEG